MEKGGQPVNRLSSGKNQAISDKAKNDNERSNALKPDLLKSMAVSICKFNNNIKNKNKLLTNINPFFKLQIDF